MATRRTHGYHAMRRALAIFGTRQVDGPVGAAVAEFKHQVATDLGGNLSRSQDAILEGCAQKLLIRDSLAAWLSGQPRLINKKRQVYPAVLTFLRVTESLERGLMLLGLERKPRAVNELDDYVAREGEKSSLPAPSSEGATVHIA